MITFFDMSTNIIKIIKKKIKGAFTPPRLLY
jgi:hypothetical protein